MSAFHRGNQPPTELLQEFTNGLTANINQFVAEYKDDKSLNKLFDALNSYSFLATIAGDEVAQDKFKNAIILREQAKEAAKKLKKQEAL